MSKKLGEIASEKSVRPKVLRNLTCLVVCSDYPVKGQAQLEKLPFVVDILKVNEKCSILFYSKF